MAGTFYLTTFVNDKTFYCRLKREFMVHHVCMGFVLLFCKVWKNEKFTFTENIFREINSLFTSVAKTLLSRNFPQKSARVNFCNFYTVFCTYHCFCRQIESEVVIQLQPQHDDYNVLCSRFYQNVKLRLTLCGNVRIYLTLRFYIKSVLAILKSQKQLF